MCIRDRIYSARSTTYFMGGRIMSTIQIYDGEKFVPFNISNAIGMPVGFEDYVSYTELDPAQLIRNGQLVSREIYSDLWNFVQSKPSMLLTEEEWQANLTANEEMCIRDRVQLELNLWL